MTDRPPEGWQPPQSNQPQQPPQNWGPIQNPREPMIDSPPGPPPKQKRPLWRRPWFIIGSVLLALVVLASVVGGDPDSPQEGTGAPQTVPQGQPPPVRRATPTTATQAPAQEPGIGDRVRDGKFEFVVRRVECGKSRVGTADFGTTAQGQFCFISVRVKNIANESQTLDNSAQFLYVDGKRYDSDTEATIYLDNAQTFLEPINPGNAINGTLIYDIPKSAKRASLETIELHDSAFSGGIDVAL